MAPPGQKLSRGALPPMSGSLVMEACEPRILYSAELLPVQSYGFDELAASSDASGEQTASAQETSALVQQQSLAHYRHELVIVDAATPDRDVLVAQLLAARGDGLRDLEVVVLEADEDGVAQISRLLSSYRDLDAVHLISHGQAGEISIGDAALNFDTLTANLAQIQGWSDAFGEDADFLIYGCDLAADLEGQALVASLASLTGADVAASTDVTGAAELGGDWDLEYQTGHIQTALALSASIQADFDSVLATFVVTNTNDSGAGSLREAIERANANAGADRIAFDIAGAGVQTIGLTSILPDITEQLAIDGYTQAGAAPNSLASGNDAQILIRIDGTGAGSGNGLSLTSSAASSEVRGLMVTGFSGHGLSVQGDNNTIAGNWIGTDGSVDLTNTGEGIVILGDGNLIGGTNPEDRNIVSGNGTNGIGIYGSAASVTVQGNWVGLDASGENAIPNAQTGIAIQSSNGGHLIGGAVAGAGNVLSGNNFSGIYLASDGISVLSNLIGVDPAGATLIGNSAGVHIENDAQNNTVGSVAAPNTIAGNQRGVIVNSAASTGNTISGNSIYQNTLSGIDLNLDGLTTNDGGDADTGPNDLLNFPVIYSANVSAGVITITGEARPGATVEFFVSDPDQRLNWPNGYGEGRAFIGSDTVGGAIAGSVDATARQFSFSFAATDVDSGALITATATDASGNTSEFSENIVVSGPPAFTIAPAILADGGETLVNATTADTQFGPLTGARNIGIDDQGNVTVVWSSNLQDGDQQGIFARRFDADGNPLTGEIAVNTTTTGSQDFPAVAVMADGRFVVAWTDFNSNSGDIYFRRFAADGTALSGQVLVNTITSGVQDNAAIAVDGYGNFNVVWEDNATADTRVKIRRYDVDGTALNGESTIASAAGVDMTMPSIARAADGRYVVAWQDSAQDGSGTGVYARVYSTHGGSLSSIFRLSTTIVGDQNNPEIAFLANGHLAAVWDSGTPDSIITRVFETDGTPITGEIQVNQATGGQRGLTGIAPGSQGSYLVTWVSDSQDGDSFGVFARQFSAGGVAMGAEFQVNSTTSGSQVYPGIASNGSGRYAIVWEGAGPGDSEGIFLQQFSEDRLTSEAGDTASLNVVLDRAPGSDVVINLSSSDTSEATAPGSTLVFTSANWNTPQSVTVTGVDDFEGDGDIQLQIDAVASSGDASFDGARAIAQAMTNLDDEPGGWSNPDAGGPYTINEGDDLNLSATPLLDPYGGPLTYRWDLDNDGNYDDLITSSASATVTWATLVGLTVDDDGTYTLGLQVEDGAGGLATDVTTLTIENTAPTLSASGLASAGGGSAYVLNLAASDPGDDTITSWTVNWGDGTITTYAGNPSSVTHTYASSLAGLVADIVVSATDEDGTHFGADALVPAYAGSNAVVYDGSSGVLRGTAAPSSDGLTGHAGIVLTPGGNYLISGHGSSNVLEYQANGALVGTFIAPGSNGLSGPAGMAFGPDGNFYITSSNTNKVLRFDASGTFIDEFITSGLSFPLGLTFGPDGDLFVASQGSAGVLRFDGTTGAPVAGFNAPAIGATEDLTIGPDGYIYAATINNGVFRLNADTGALIDNFITPGANLVGAAGITFGPDGNLYVADQDGDAIRMFASDGSFLGDYVNAGYGGLDGPAYLAFDPDQRVTLTAANLAPVLTAAVGGGTHNEGASGTYFYNFLTITDADSADFNTGVLTTTVTNNGETGDRLFVRDGGGVTVSGSDVLYNDGGGAVVIGTLAGGDYTNPLTITFNAASTSAGVQAVGQQVAFRTEIDDPSGLQRTLQMVVSDGDGGTSAIATRAMNVIPINDAPVNTVPGTQTVDEEAITAISGISVVDADDQGASLTTRLQTGAGVLNLVLSGAATISAGSNGTGDLTILGTASDVNATLASLTYTGNPDLTGIAADTLTVTTNDQGNTGVGGAQQDVDTVQIDITAVNDAPVLDPSDDLRLPTLTEDELGNPGQTVAQVLASAGGDPISDADAGALEGIAITTRNNGRGIWQYSVDGGSNWFAVGTVSEAQALLLRATDLVRFEPDGNNGTSSDRSIVFRAWDQTSGAAGTKVDVSSNGGSSAFSTATETAVITTTDVNDAPSLDNSASLSLTAQTEDAGVPAGATGTLITDLVAVGGNVSDVDASATTGIAITALNASAGSLWYTTDGGANWALSGALSDANALLLAADSNTRLYLQTPAQFNGTIAAAITFNAWDGSAGANGSLADASSRGGTTPFSSATEVADLTVTAVNDAPVNTVPGTQTVAEEMTTAIGGISIADVDAGAALLTTRLQVGNGSLAVTLSGAASISAGSNGSADLTIQGTAADINATLASLAYTGNTNVNGVAADTLTVTTNDQGNTGSGGAQQDVDTVQIDITAVNDAPVNTVPGTQAVAEETATAIGGISIADVDDLGANLTTRLQVSNGVLNVTLSGSATISAGSNDSGDLTILGSEVDINATLASLSYTGNSNVNGTAADTLTVTTNDQGNTGSGGAQQDVDTVQIDITAVNDSPVNTVPGTQTVAEETTTPIGGISITDADDLGASLTTRLQVSVGVLSVTLSGAASISAGSNGSNDLTILGTEADINASLASLTYTGNTDVNGVAADTLTVTTDDQGNTGSGGAQQDVDTVQIDITGVNDAPVNTVPGTQTVAEETTTAIGGISIADVDDLGGNLTTRLQVTAGVFNVILSGAATISAGSNGSADLTILGTEADINATLASLSYTGNTDVNGVAADTLTVTTNDQGNTGSGGAQQDVDTVQIDITAVNDAPVNTVPGTQAVAEETITTIGGISIADADDLGANLTTRLQVSNGVLNVTLSGSATISAGSNGSGDLTILGTEADINATLVSLSYTGNTDVNGVAADTLTVTANDQGNTGSGGAQQDVDTVQIDITAVNDAPVLTVAAGGGTHNEGATGTYFYNLLTITDADSADFDGGVLTTSVTNNGEAGDRLFVRDGGGVTVSGGDVLYDDGGGAVVIGTLAGGDGTNPLLITFNPASTVTGVQAVAQQVAFRTEIDDPSGLQRTLQMVVTDGDGGTSAAATRAMNVIPINDAPVNTVPGTQTVAEETATAIGGISIIDADDHGADLSTRLQVTAGVLNVTLSGSATISAGSNGSSDLTILGNEADINATLASLSYSGNTDVNGVAADTLTVTTNDEGNTGSGGAQQDVDTVQIDITSLNDPPVNTVPGTQTVAEETTIAIGGISIADVDDLGANLTTRLQVSNGVLNVTLSGSATISAGGNGSNDLTILGIEADINATLASLSYTGNTDVTGVAADTLTVTTNDQGNTGSGGAQQDVDTVQIDITAVNDAPVNTVPGTQTVSEETATAISGVSISDVDAGGAALTTRLQVSNGALSVTLSGAATIAAGTNGSADLTVQGTVTDINATLASLTYTGNTNVNGVAADTLTVTTSDLGNTGSGGALQDMDTVQIDVTAVNDAPVNSVPGTQTVIEETATAISGISISDADAGGAALTTRLQVSDGLLSVTVSGAATIAAGSNGSADLTIQGTVADINATLATLSYTGNIDVTGTAADTLTVTTNDQGNTGSGGAQQDVDTVQIDITAVNDAPVNTIPGIQTVAEETTTAIGGISIADVDDLGGNLTARLQVSNGVLNVTLSGSATISAGSNGSGDLTIQGTETDINATLASLTYTGNAEVTGTAADSLTLTTNDQGNTGSGGAQSDVDTVQIDIAAVDDAPIIALNTGASLGEGATVTIENTMLRLDDVDTVAGARVYTLSAAPATGSLRLNGSALSVGQTFTQADIDNNRVDYLHSDAEVFADGFSFTYGDATTTGLGPTTFTLSITPVNDNDPVFVSANTPSVAENITAVQSVNASDADLPAQVVTYSVVPTGSGGAVDASRFTIDTNSGVLSFASAPDYDSPVDADSNNEYLVTVRANDNAGRMTDQLVTVTVTNVNEVPAGTDNSVSMLEDSSYTFTLADFGYTDPDAGDTLDAVRIDSLPGAGNLVLSGVPVTAGQVLTAADIAASNLVFTPAPDSAGIGYATFTFSVRDPGGLFDPAPNLLNIDVTTVDDAPSLALNAAANLAEGNAMVIDNSLLRIDDVDSPATARIYTLTSLPATGSLRLNGAVLASGQTFTQDDIDNNRVDYLHNGAEVFTDSFTFTYGDATTTGIGPETFTLSVTPVNDNAPVIISDGGNDTAALQVQEQGSAITTLQASDADVPVQSISFIVTGGADAGQFTIDSVTGALAFVSPPDFEAPTDANTDNVYEVAVQASDPFGLVDTQTILVQVLPLNENAPVITSDGGGDAAVIGLPENSTAVTTVTASDIDLPAGPLGFSIVGGADAGQLRIDPLTGVLTMVQAPDFEQSQDADGDNVFEVIVQVSDGLLTDSQALSIVVQDVNEAPQDLQPAQISASESVSPGAVLARFAVQDPDTGDVAVFSLTDDAGGLFVVTADSGELRLAADGRLDYELAATHELTVRVTDGAGNTLQRRVVIDVGDEPEFDSNQDNAGSPVPAASDGQEIASPSAPVVHHPAQAPAAAARDEITPEPAAQGADPEIPVLTIDVSIADTRDQTSAATVTEILRRLRPGEPPKTSEIKFELLLPSQNFSLAPVTLDFEPLVKYRVTLNFDSAETESASQEQPESLADLLLDPIRVSSTLASVGLVWWLTRAGGLVTTILMGIPTWRHLDLLPIVSRPLGDESRDKSREPDLPGEEIFGETIAGEFLGPQKDSIPW